MTDGAVLAGGGGRRFGGPKADAVLAGRTLVERAVAALARRCEEVIVVSRPGVPLPPLPVRVVHDRPGPDAPLVAVATALARLAGDEVLVLACDLPLAEPFLDDLLAAEPGRAVVAAADGAAQPLCGRYPRLRALAACERLLAAGTLQARGLVDAMEALLLEAPGEALLNVNSREDLRRAERLLRGPPTAG